MIFFIREWYHLIIAIKTYLKRIEDSSLRIGRIISDVLDQIYQYIEFFAKIRVKQIRGYHSTYPKLKDVKENLRYKHRRYIREEDKLFFGRIIGFLN